MCPSLPKVTKAANLPNQHCTSALGEVPTKTNTEQYLGVKLLPQVGSCDPGGFGVSGDGDAAWIEA